MSQFGMQMPGGQLRRGPSMNVYTGLLFLAFASLLAASLFIALVQGPKLGKGGSPFGMQESGKFEPPPAK